MADDVILLDGVKYFRYSPEKEDDFEELVVKNAREIFGEEAIYLDIKKKIASALGEGAIPDGYLFYPEEKRFVLVEVELSSHDVYSHVSKQISKFISAFGNYRSRQSLASTLREHIECDPLLHKRMDDLLKGKGLYEFLLNDVFEKLFETKSYEIIVVIENETRDVNSALDCLNPKPQLLEVAVYARENAPTVKAIRYQSKEKKELKSKPPETIISSSIDFPIPIFANYKGKRYEAKLNENGQVELLGRTFNSVSGAAKSIVDTGQVNGWRFWNISLQKGVKSIQSIRKNIIRNKEGIIEQEEKRNIRCRKGERTPEKDYQLPLLKALIELGGSGKVRDVLNSVGKIMKKKLKPLDYQPTPSGKNIRWENTTQWCRNTLKKKGYVADNSPFGVWEITEKGRRYFEQHKDEI